MLNYWGIFFMCGFVPACISALGVCTYLCEKNENKHDKRLIDA